VYSLSPASSYSHGPFIFGGLLRFISTTYFSRVDAKRLQATEFSRFGAHLYSVHVSRKYPTLVASSPGWFE
jgi:hypothetical protein